MMCIGISLVLVILIGMLILQHPVLVEGIFFNIF